MISHRLLNSEICGLRGRVTACRKRLRVNRVAQRAHINGEVEMSAGDVNLKSSAPAMIVLRLHPTPFAEAKCSESETLILAGEQEVGIT